MGAYDLPASPEDPTDRGLTIHLPGWEGHEEYLSWSTLLLDHLRVVSTGSY